MKIGWDGCRRTADGVETGRQRVTQDREARLPAFRPYGRLGDHRAGARYREIELVGKSSTRGEIASGLHGPELRARRCCVCWQSDQGSQCDDQRTDSFQKICSRHFVVLRLSAMAVDVPRVPSCRATYTVTVTCLARHETMGRLAAGSCANSRRDLRASAQRNIGRRGWRIHFQQT